MLKMLGVILAFAGTSTPHLWTKPHLLNTPPITAPLTFGCDAGYTLYSLNVVNGKPTWIAVAGGSYVSVELAQHSGPLKRCYLTSKGAPSK